MLTLDGKPDAWPKRMDTGTAARYLQDEHGLPTEPKTLVNHRAQRKGPVVQYFGAKPLYDRAELDRWANEDALQPVSPLTRNALRRLHGRAERGESEATGVADAAHSAATTLPGSPSASVSDDQKRT